MDKIRRFTECAGESLRKGLAKAEEKVGIKISCIVSDIMMTFVCRDIAEERGIKWVALSTSSAIFLALVLYTDQLKEAVESVGMKIEGEEYVDEYLPGFPSGIRFKDLPDKILTLDDSSPFAAIINPMSVHLPKAAAVAVRSFDTLEPSATNLLKSSLGDKFLNVGPSPLTMPTPLSFADPNCCLQWLNINKPTSVVYISFGSRDTLPPEEVTSLAEALQASKVPFLWSLPERFEPYLPVGFLEMSVGMVVPWAPQKSVLAHSSVAFFVTHCGWNSVMESVVSGVPLICRPFLLAEQLINARMVCNLFGIGLEVEGGRLTKATTLDLLEKIMTGDKGRTARANIKEIKTMAEVAAQGQSAHNLTKFITLITSS